MLIAWIMLCSAAAQVLLYEWKSLKFDLGNSGLTYEDSCCMPAGVKVNSMGEVFISVPRWKEGVPSTFNRVKATGSEYVFEPWPSLEYNTPSDPTHLFSVLGFEIDLDDNIWVLDQGKMNGQPAGEGTLKLVKFAKDGEVKRIYELDTVASLESSFLNDVVLDFKHGYAYISDSGVPTTYFGSYDPGIIVVNINSGQAVRVLDKDPSTMPDPSLWVTINGGRVNATEPMQTGVDGIALSCGKDYIYYTPLTSRWLYAIKVDDVLDHLNNPAGLSSKVIPLEYRPSASDGLIASKKGRLYLTGIETNGIYMYENSRPKHKDILSNKNLMIAHNDTEMIWPDTMGFDNKRQTLLFVSNQLQNYEAGTLDFSKVNFRVWSLDVNDKTYLHSCEYESSSDSSSGFPVWAIVLILLMTTIFTAGIVILVKKYREKKRLKQEFASLDSN